MSGTQDPDILHVDVFGNVVCPGCKKTFGGHHHLGRHLDAKPSCQFAFHRQKPSIAKRKLDDDANLTAMRRKMEEVLSQSKELAKRRQLNESMSIDSDAAASNSDAESNYVEEGSEIEKESHRNEVGSNRTEEGSNHTEEGNSENEKEASSEEEEGMEEDDGSIYFLPSSMASLSL